MNKKLLLKGFFAAILSVAFATIFGGTIYAETVLETGLFTDENDVRWEYNRSVDTDTEAEAIAIKFFDKPAATTEIIVPSLSEVLQKVPNAAQNLDTYYLDGASEVLQSFRFTETKRESTAAVNKVDFTNTSKIQVLGVESLIDPETETEIIFGENMVISDKKTMTASFNLCTSYEHVSGANYRCTEMTHYDTTNFVSPSWYLSFGERAYINDFAAYLGVGLDFVEWNDDDGNYWFTLHCPDDSPCDLGEPDGSIIYSNYHNEFKRKESQWNASGDAPGVFGGYKLKLSNLSDISGFNYVGWWAFQDAIFSDTTIVINGDGYKGSSIFSGSNVQKAIINVNDTGEGLFRGCADITEIEFGENVTSIGSATFMNTNLGSLDLSATNIKTINESAFKNANISTLNLGNVVNLWFESFKDNNLTELYLPKSIEFLGTRTFQNNNINKVTVAYDTMTYGTILPFWQVMNGDSNWSGGQHIEELNIVAPYGPEDPFGPTHISYDEYKWGYSCLGGVVFRDEHVSFRPVSSYASPCPADGNGRSYAYNGGYSGIGGYLTDYGEYNEQDYIDIASMKNVIAPTYFSHLRYLKRINIGDGFEFIGDYAFLDTAYLIDGTGIYGDDAWRRILNEGQTSGTYYTNITTKVMERIDLPESLKGVGNLAFNAVSGLNFEMTLPSGLEFIGIAAFRNFVNFEFDFYFPELKFLGDNAFTATQVHNITLNDKLRYVGFAPFQDCLFINDVTIDYDLFNPQKNEYYNRRGVYGDGNFFSFFGTAFLQSITEEGSAELGYNIDKVPYEGRNYYQDDNGRWEHEEYYGEPVLRFGTITFTDKVQADYPMSKWTTSASGGDRGRAYFGFMAADKLDLSQSGWKVIPPYFFTGSKFGEILLPENLETIYNDAFNSTVIGEELVLPDSIIAIEDNAFHQEWLLEYNRRSGQNIEPVKITHLPTSLRRVGNYAFYNAMNLEIETFDLPDLEYIGYNAFPRTKIKNIILHDKLTSVLPGAFSPNKSIENITIDCDFYGIASSFFQVFSKADFLGDYQAPGEYSGQWNNATINTFGNVVYTEKAVTEPANFGATFSDINFATLDFSATPWKEIPSAWGMTRDVIGKLYLPSSLEVIPVGFFEEVVTEEPIKIPETVVTISSYAFNKAKFKVENGLHEGIKTIDYVAFNETNCFDDLVIPSTVEFIGSYAFNAGSVDVLYNSVTIKPVEFTFEKTAGQSIFQMFWNAKINKLVIESEVLPTISALDVDNSGNYIAESGRMVCLRGEDSASPQGCIDADGNPAPERFATEFHGLKVKEVALNNARAITTNAFEDCPDLETVDLSGNTNLQFIGRNAFLNANKLTKVAFNDSLEGKDVAIGEYAFKGTGIETIGIDGEAGFNLAAANFNTQITHRDADTNEVVVETDSHAFAEMPALRSVSVPANFAGGNVPAYTFADDPELAEATLTWQVASVDDGTFVGDHKLKKLFVWGDTNIIESDEFVTATSETTVPQETTIFAYSDAPAEAYANDASRDDYEGKFYALDEVLYLTTNKTYVVLEQDEEGNNVDFNKEGLKLYALRRDGVVLQSDNWQEYTTAYSRNNVPAEEGTITFEEGRGALGSDEADIAGQVYDAEKPFNTISLANQNYANVNFAFIQMPSSNNPLVLINYPDGYTGNIRTATLASMTKAEEEYLRRLEEELEVPNTGVFGTIVGVATSTVSIATVVVLSGIYVFSKRRK